MTERKISCCDLPPLPLPLSLFNLPVGLVGRVPAPPRSPHSESANTFKLQVLQVESSVCWQVFCFLISEGNEVFSHISFLTLFCIVQQYSV